MRLKRHRLRAIFSCGFCIGLLSLVAACAKEAPPPEIVTPRVKVHVVGKQATGQARRISGKLVAAERVSLSFSVDGTVAEVLVSPGDTVAEGQLVARIDSTPIALAVEQARSAVGNARAAAVEKRQIYERSLRLFDKQAGSQAEVDNATAAYAQARGDVDSRQSALRQAERDLANTRLVAPFAARVASRDVEPFQEIKRGDTVFVLQSEDALEVELLVPETLIRHVDHGQAVSISFPTLPDVTRGGVVTEIAASAEAGNAFPVQVRLSGPPTDLRAGMTASVTFNFDRYLDGRSAFLVPFSALALEAGVLKRLRSGAEPVPRRAPVFVVAQDGKLELRELTVGDLRGNELEVFEGLEAGEQIVAAGTALLREGMTVESWEADQGLTSG